MLNTLQTSDFKMHSRNQALNFEFLRDRLKKNNRLENPLLKMQTDVQLRLMKNPLLKMKDNIRLKLDRLPFLKNQLGSIYIKPP